MKGLDKSSFFSIYIDSINDRFKLGQLRYELIRLIYEISINQAIQSSGVDGDLFSF